MGFHKNQAGKYLQWADEQVDLHSKPQSTSGGVYIAMDLGVTAYVTMMASLASAHLAAAEAKGER